MQVAQAEGLIAKQGLGSSEALPQQTATKVKSTERGREAEGRGGEREEEGFLEF